MGLFEVTKKEASPEIRSEPIINHKYLLNPNPFIQEWQFDNMEQPIAELIQRRRLQMLIHSKLYYDMNTNLIMDKQFDDWGKELVQLQKDYPDIASKVCFAKAFEDWDASTGAFLPLQDPWVIRKAQQLLSINSGASKGDNGKLEHKKVQQSTRVESSKKPKGKKAAKQRGNSLF